MKTFTIYIDIHNDSCFEIHTATTLAEAEKWCNDYVAARQVVDDEHPCSEDVFNSAAVAQLFVYDGDPVTGDPDDPETKDTVYESPYFYTEK